MTHIWYYIAWAVIVIVACCAYMAMIIGVGHIVDRIALKLARRRVK